MGNPPARDWPFQEFLDRQGVVVLDGGLATELEARGHDLSHPLWSGRVLLEDPDAIRRVHTAYLEAGADCITAATYQVSVPGCAALGLDTAQAQGLLTTAVDLACAARDEFVAEMGPRTARCRPLVAASVGPYGAYLANGAEYTGLYDVSDPELRGFHESRWATLMASGADLLACETVPSAREASVLMELIRETDCPAWLSFSCKDEAHLCDGSSLADVATMARACDPVIAVGVNCTAPQHISGAIERLWHAAPSKPVIVYPNAGLRYDSGAREWVGSRSNDDLSRVIELACRWHDQGATLIGGCCGLGPEYVRQLRTALVECR